MIDAIRGLRLLAVTGLVLAWTAATVSGEGPSGTESRRLRFVVMSPHTDDAEFAGGGVVDLLVRPGHDVIIANMDSGGEIIAAKTKAILGAQTVEWLGFKDTAIDEAPDARDRVAKYLDRKRPNVVLAPWLRQD
ncbi:MAG: PIG-L family deacetylase [Planctomycetes bacterium]|nr:PIG-L family deacetylase [Planctomycetota bacterium]